MRKSTHLTKNVICYIMSSLKPPTCMLQDCTVLFKRMWNIIDCCMFLKLENFMSHLCIDVEFHCYRTSPVTVDSMHALMDSVTVAVCYENI